MSKVFGKKEDEIVVSPTDEAAAPVSEEVAAEEVAAEEAPAAGEEGVVGETGEAAPAAEPVAAPAPEPVDVTAMLDEMAANHAEDLDWKKSIVDLMKLVGMDASYKERKELAAEVGIEGYEGTEDQNIALHKIILKKISENGGNVPADLLD